MATYLRKSGAARAVAGAVLTIDGDGVGFPPKYIEIVNETNGATLKWFEAMGSGHALVNDGAGAQTMVTSGGITPTATGFTIGTNLANINDTNGELLSYHVTG